MQFLPFTFTLTFWCPFIASLGHIICLLSGNFLLPSPSQNICCFVQAVLSAHDTVAQKNFDPVLPPLPEELDEDFEEESVKIVRLVKNKEPLVRKMMMKFMLLFFLFKSDPSNQSRRGKPYMQSC